MATNTKPENVDEILTSGNTVRIKQTAEKSPDLIARILDSSDARGILVHRQRGDENLFLPWASIQSIKPISEEEYQDRSTATVKYAPGIF
jgi:hypothetical protein